MNSKPLHPRSLALLIPAHNEALVLKQTVQSAMAAGMKKDDIYVVVDKSDDQTAIIAKRLLDTKNVMVLRHRAGKGLALTKGANKFKLAKRYRWIHIADADGYFEPGYFWTLRRDLNDRYVAATGYVKSLPGDTVSKYRVYEYTLGMEVHRRFQSLAGLIAVLPGPTSCFRSDIFGELRFDNGSLTEDFDVTLQIHRQRLGKIQFIPEATVHTQDPKNFGDFYQQITRWNRGIFQAMRRHRIGLRPRLIDSYLLYQVFQSLSLAISYGLIMPLLALRLHSPNVVALAFLADLALVFAATLAVARISRRGDIMAAFPFIYFYRLVVLGVFLKAFFEVMVLRRFKSSVAQWETANRRYRNVQA